MSPLFEKEFIDSLPEPKPYIDNGISSLCKNQKYKTVILLLEKWFNNFPDKEKADIKGRFTSTEKDNQASAFYELMFHQFLIEEGFEVEKNKKSGDGTPDYFIKTATTSLFVEIYTLFNKETTEEIKTILFLFLEELNKLKIPYIIDVRPRQLDKDNLHIPAIITKIIEFSSSISKETTGYHTFNIQENGFDGEINIRNKTENDSPGSIVKSFSYPDGCLNESTKRIQNKIRKKVSKYKKIKEGTLPYVIAICDETEFPPFNATTIDRALYGEIQISWDINNPEAETEACRDYNGLVTPNKVMKINNTRISAIIHCYKRWNIEKENFNFVIKVYHNPWAKNPLPIDIFDKVPQLAKLSKSETEIKLEWTKEENTEIYFNL